MVRRIVLLIVSLALLVGMGLAAHTAFATVTAAISTP